MIRACCFDMDGVLFDTERAGGLIMSRAAAEQGFQAEPASWVSLIGTTMAQTGAALVERYPGMDVPRFMDDWKRLTLVWAAEGGLPFKPFAAETLERLKADGIRLALCSSNDPEVVWGYLRLAGWTGLFHQVVTCDQVPRSKPAPDIYLEACRRLDIPPAMAVGVEDSPAGLAALRAAGLHSVMVPDLIPYGPRVAENVDTLLTSLETLPELIHTL